VAGVADTQMKRLQSVQNVAAQLVSGARRRDHITPVMCSLHWLPGAAEDHFQDRSPCVEMYIARWFPYSNDSMAKWR